MSPPEHPPSVFRRFLDILRAGFFPRRCAGCRSFLPWPSLHAAQHRSPKRYETLLDGPQPWTIAPSTLFEPLFATWVCADCQPAWQPLISPCCPVCGLMFESRQGSDHVCGKCLKNPPWFTQSRSAGIYSGVYMELIHHYKFKRRLQLADPLGVLLLAVFLRYWHEQAVDLLLPVPLHPRRLRQRGFNQAFLLVQHWPRMAQALNLKGMPAIRLHVLQRHRYTQPQTSLKRHQRQSNLKNAFSVHGNAVQDQHVVLVDDVHTTGATLNECAHVLRRAGARRVDALTLARTL